MRLGKDLPECEWFWPIYKDKEENLLEAQQTIHAIKSKRLKIETPLDEICEIRHFYANGSEAPTEINFYELNETELQIR